MLRNILSTSILFCLLVAVTPARAQDTSTEVPTTYHIYRLPKGSQYSLAGGERVRCYSFEQYKLLLTMDNDLHKAEETARELFAFGRSLQTANLALSASLKVSNQQLELISKDRDRIFTEWKSENLARHKAENRPVLGSWIPWTISGLSAALAVGLFVGVLAL